MQMKQVPMWVLEDTSTKEIVGFVPTIPVELKCGGKRAKLFWGVDIYQGRKGLGVQMIKAMLNWRSCGDVTMGKGVSPLGYSIQRKLGWQDSIFPRVMVKPLRPNNIWLQITKNNALSEALGGLSKPLLSVHKAVTRIAAPQDITVSQVKRIDSRFDRFWSAASKQHKTIVRRDAKYLGWRFDQHPKHKYVKFVATRRGAMVGYMVCRLERNSKSYKSMAIGFIVDFLVSDAEAFPSLLNSVLAYFDEKRADIAVTLATDSTFIKYLKRAGFLRTSKELKVIYHLNALLKCFDGGKELFLTLSDSDGDMR